MTDIRDALAVAVQILRQCLLGGSTDDEDAILHPETFCLEGRCQSHRYLFIY